MNQHLAASGSKRTVSNFSEDLKDGGKTSIAKQLIRYQ